MIIKLWRFKYEKCLYPRVKCDITNILQTHCQIVKQTSSLESCTFVRKKLFFSFVFLSNSLELRGYLYIYMYIHIIV